MNYKPNPYTDLEIQRFSAVVQKKCFQCRFFGKIAVKNSIFVQFSKIFYQRVQNWQKKIGKNNSFFDAITAS